jgi:hypothetical protein
MAYNLKPFRDYDEHDVINLFSFSGDSTHVVKGLAVKVMAPGFNPGITNVSPTELLGNVGGNFGSNVVSQRYGVAAKVAVAASGEAVLGLTLMDVRETDENGEKLVFNPRKAAEMGVVVSGQAVPVLTKGLVMYSGTNATAGHVAYVGATAGELASAATLPAGGAVKVGRWLSTAVQEVALLKIEL